MKRRIIVSICCLLMLVATPFAARDTQAQGGTGLSLLTELSIPDSVDSKYPQVAARSGLVHISGNANRRDAFYWTKGDTSVSALANPLKVGTADGQPDYSNTSVAVGPDGAIYYAWDNQPERTVYLRRRDPATGAWGPQRVVNSGSDFPVSVRVAVSSSNEIFVIWRDPDEIGKMRRSLDGGASWLESISMSSTIDVYGVPLDIASGPNGLVVATFTAFDGGKLQVFASLWDPTTSSFDIQRVSTAGAHFANGSVSISSNGTVYMAWRGVDTSGGSSGVFYAERQPDGSWPRSRIVSGDIVGPVSIDTNEQNDLNLTWVSRVSGNNQVYYAFKPAADTFRGPIAAGARGLVFNVNSAASISGANDLFTHTVYELFNGGTLRTRYLLFQATGATFGAEPLIEGNAATIARKSSVQVAFRNPRGLNLATTQVRWRWNAAPTDTATDSGGWKTYASTIAVPVPTSILNDTSCTASTLYTQLRDTGTGVLEQPAKSDSILIDGVIESAVDLYNPFIEVPNSLSGITSATVLSPELALSKGAVGDGNPTYTRVPLVYLKVQNLGDCTGIASIAVGTSASTLETTYKSDGDGFSGMVPLPDLANLETGTRPVVVQVRDGAGNVVNNAFNLIYDDEKPALNVGGSGPKPVAASPHPAGDLFQNLTFTNLSVTDDLYTAGSREFWGVWVANSRISVADPADDPDLNWVALPAPGTTGSFTIKDWSLATGLTKAEITSGTYYIYARVLDGAGNASDQVLSLSLTSNARPVKTHLPLTRR